MKTIRYNLEAIEEALEKCAKSVDGHFTCILLNLAQSRFNNSPERLLHERIFECRTETFHCKLKADKESTEDEKLRQIRLLSLAFTYEIARLKNNRKASGF